LQPGPTANTSAPNAAARPKAVRSLSDTWDMSATTTTPDETPTVTLWSQAALAVAYGKRTGTDVRLPSWVK
jgi:hypothetical protein